MATAYINVGGRFLFYHSNQTEKLEGNTKAITTI
jgi:hypothetical protein